MFCGSENSMYKQNRCFPLITRHKIASPNSNLRLLHLYESYHKTCEQFNRNLERYAKSPNSFLPGLSLSIISQFRFYNFLHPCLASVYLPSQLAIVVINYPRCNVSSSMQGGLKNRGIHCLWLPAPEETCMAVLPMQYTPLVYRGKNPCPGA